MLLQRLQRLAVLGLDAELAGPGPNRVHHQGHPRQDVRRKVLHQLGVFVNQRLTFGPIGNQEFHLRLRFHVGREAGASGPHHAAFAQLLAEHNSQG